MNLHYLKPLGILMLSVVGFTPDPGHAASYSALDCAKASTAAETTICKSYALGQDEARVATLFGVLTSLVAMGQRSDLVDTQRRWIASRERCGSNAECLSRVYATRINELSQALDALAKRGPF
ncbi:lysozyme inhibitor LprI family protein [Bradyrhizobium sp. ORS 86]|uniref:lysozyme inhibitor LprI family protein n=1 Tax=Bradyrhizobium sp. ORS 86 TaxID=1685970 RepID=UPI00388E0AFE